MALQCGFSRCVMYTISKKLAKKNGHLTDEALKLRIQEYNEFFIDTPGLTLDHVNIEDSKTFYKFNQTIKRILDSFRKPRWDKDKYLETFSATAWNLLPQVVKQNHSYKNCAACDLMFANVQSSFPIKPVLTRESLISKAAKSCATLVGEGQKTAVTENLFHEFDKVFTDHGEDFGTALTKIKNSQLCKKLPKSKKQTQLNNIRRKVKSSIENTLHTVDAMRPYSFRESLQKYQKITREEMLSPTTAPKKQKLHSPQNMDFDLDEVIAELSTLPDGSAINWEGLGRKYGVKSSNKGQVVKEALRRQNINISKYKNSLIRQRNTVYRRRAKRRLIGGKITIPSHLTQKQVRERMREEIRNGKFNLGVACTIQECTKLKLHNGVVQKEIIEVDGRKIPLLQIRKSMLEKQEQMGVLRTNTDEEIEAFTRETVILYLKQLNCKLNENDDTTVLRNRVKSIQRRRHLKIWHDHSSIENHGHLLICCSGIYDEAVYLSNSEFKTRFGWDLDVEAFIEHPEVYLLGRCSSSSADQLTYIPTRKEDMQQMAVRLKTNSGIEIEDVIRFHHGDSPSVQFESGISQGGEFCCCLCSAQSQRFGDLAYCLRQPVRTLTEIQRAATAGRHLSTPGLVKPVTCLKKGEIIEELQDRGLDTDGSLDVLRSRLKEDLSGVVSVPKLLIERPSQSLTELNMQHLEILSLEPMHCCKGHIENVLSELKSKKRSTVCDLINSFCTAVFGGKELLRGRDYRDALKILPNYLSSKNAPAELCLLLQSLLEIVVIMYLRPSVRNNVIVLRLYNQVLLHHILLKEVVGQPYHLSHRKLMGVYFHQLTSHAPLICRIVSPRSINAEQQEALFNRCKQISRNTSNHHLKSIVPNLLIRLQAEDKVNDPVLQDVDTDSFQVFTGNTIIKSEWLHKYPNLLQAHCEQISDFMVEGPSVWWQYTDDGNVAFLDNPNDLRPSSPPIEHFRDATLQQIKEKLKCCWQEIIQRNVKLPLVKLKVYTNGRLAKVIQLSEGAESNLSEGEYVEVQEDFQNSEPEAPEEIFGVEPPQQMVSSDPVCPTVNEVSTHSDDHSERWDSSNQVTLPHLSPVPKSSQLCSPPQPDATPGPSTYKHNCKTKTGQLLEVILGSLPEVLVIDNYRLKLRDSSGYMNKFYSTKLEEDLLTIKPMVLKAYHAFTEKVKLLENNFFSLHGRLPNLSDSEELKQLIRKRSYAMKLLDSWKWYYY